MLPADLWLFAAMFANVTLAEHSHQPRAVTLTPGQVFNMRAIAPGNGDVNLNLIRVYGDSTLGIRDPDNAEARPFHGVYMQEYGLILQPEPLQCIKPNYQSVLMVNDSLYSPSTNVQVRNGRISFSTPVHICPSLNHVLVQSASHAVQCHDAVPVELELVASTVDMSGTRNNAEDNDDD